MKVLVLCAGNRCRSRIILIRTYEKNYRYSRRVPVAFILYLILIIQPSLGPCRHPSQALS